MRNFCRLAATSVLALSVVACGSPAQDDGSDSAGAGANASGVEATVDGTTGAATSSDTGAVEAAGESAAPATPPVTFTQCQVCHQIAPGQNGIGPSLAGVFGSQAGHVSNFSYTEAMRSSGLTWDEATLDRYLANPSGLVPGTTMAIGQISDEDRADIIAYLKTL